jgi:hypothetical protein
MLHPHAFHQLFSYTFTLVHAQLQQMTHAQSLLAPPWGGNCINWLVGHLISSRMRALTVLNRSAFWSDAQRSPYRSGSPPLTPTTVGVLPLAQLQHDFRHSQILLLDGLAHCQVEDLGQRSGYQDTTIGESLAYYHFHEAHHVGQIVYLAPFVGVAAVWLPQ